MSNLSNTLKWKRIGDVFDVKDGTHESPKYVDNNLGYPLVTSKNIKDGKLVLDNCNYISKADFDKINNRSKVDVNDIIMPMIGTIGNPHLIVEEPNYAIKNVALFKPKEDLSKFLLYWLKSDFIKNKFLNDSRGGTQKFVSLKYLRELTIPLPSLTKQKEITSTLDKAQELISLRKESIKKLDELSKSIFIDMFGDPVSNPKNIPTKMIKEIGKVQTGNTPSRKDAENYGEFIEWIKSDNILRNKFYISKSRECLSEKGYKKARVVKENSLLITCIAGSMLSIGNVAIVNREVTFNQQINSITPTHDNVFYLYFAIKLAKKYIEENSSKSMKIMINKTTFENLSLPIPDIKEQNKFAKIIKKIEEQKSLYEEELEKLEENFKALLQKSFK